MMKSLIRIAALAALVAASALSASAQAPALSQYHTITEQWTAPLAWTGSGQSVPCSATVTTYCVWNYTETLTPPAGGQVLLTASSTAYSWSPAAGAALYCGTYTVSIVANWLDGNGLPVASPPLTGSTVVPCPFTASPATGLTGKVS